MLGIDLDGTLLDGEGELSEANIDAVHRAQAAGVRVVPCTGRSWVEAHYLLEPIADLELGVFVTGAAISNIASGESIDLAVIEPHLALRIVELLFNEPEAVLVFSDRNEAGHDYLVTGRGELTPNTEWWFEFNEAKVRHRREVDEVALRHTLRVGMVASTARMRQIAPRIEAELGDEVLVHHFVAVQRPDPEESVDVLEVFAAGVDKWRGLRWLAAQDGTADDQIAVIGDQINDIAMLRNAGCGIAMGNATDAAKQAADFVTRTNAEDGVAFAIDQLLSGRWE
jgi:Cof subfamily protein (haloacid dehalogenase superfamily)